MRTLLIPVSLGQGSPQRCLCLPSLSDGAEHSFSRGLGINELTFENCLGDELEVLSIAVSRGSLKITSLKLPNK